MTDLEKAIDMLVKDGINSFLIDSMTESEILETLKFDDYDEYNDYMTGMAMIYDI